MCPTALHAFLGRAWHCHTTCQFLALCSPARVGVALHDDSLHLGNATMIAGGHDACGHLQHAQAKRDEQQYTLAQRFTHSNSHYDYVHSTAALPPQQALAKACGSRGCVCLRLPCSALTCSVPGRFQLQPPPPLSSSAQPLRPPQCLQATEGKKAGQQDVTSQAGRRTQYTSAHATMRWHAATQRPLCLRLPLLTRGPPTALIAQKARNHQLGTVAKRIDSAVLDHDALVVCEQCLRWESARRTAGWQEKTGVRGCCNCCGAAGPLQATAHRNPPTHTPTNL